MTKLKICGVTQADDTSRVAAAAGVDYLGLNFGPSVAAAITRSIRGRSMFASGVEFSPGIKDPAKLAAFVVAIRSTIG